MNVKRFTGRTSRDALNLVRQSFGDDAVVLSTRPCAEGVEVLAMAPDGMQQIEKAHTQAPAQPRAARAAAPAAPARSAAPVALPTPPSPARAAGLAARAAAQVAAQPAQGAALPPARMPAADKAMDPEIDQDVAQLGMSTLTFQDYVRERMLKRRRAELAEAGRPAAPSQPAPRAAAAPRAEARAAATPAAAAAAHRAPPVLREEVRFDEAPRQEPQAAPSERESDMMSELRSMKGLIEQRFGALAFMEKLQKSPRQAKLSQRLLDVGFSPALARKLCDALPDDVADEAAWASSVLERNLIAAEQEPALEDAGGVYALIGATGVGKTTSTAKIAAAFATRHGAGQLGLITLDAYRVGAHEQLRTYGRILGVPVHTAHDRASLEDLLELLSAKKMVLIDTAGMAQRDARTRELLDMLSHRAIQKLLVVNAAAQGETIEDVLTAYRAGACRGVVLSKLDEAVKLAPALDALIRHKLRVVGIANGQRVPEDWHRLSAPALVQRAMRATPAAPWRVDANDVNLLFAGLHAANAAAVAAAPRP